MKRISSTKWARETVEARNVTLSTQYNISYYKPKVHHSVRLRFKDVFEDLGHDYSDLEFKNYIVEFVRFEDGTAYERGAKNTVVADEESMDIKEIDLVNEAITRRVCVRFYKPTDTMDRIDIITVNMETGIVEHHKIIKHNYHCSNEYSITNRYSTPKHLSIDNYHNLEFLIRNEKYDRIPNKILNSIEYIDIQKRTQHSEVVDTWVTTISSDLTLYPDIQNINDVNTYPVNVKTTKTRYEIEDESLYSDEAMYEQVEFHASVLAFDGNIHSEYRGIQYTKTKQIVCNYTIYKIYHSTNFEGRDDDKLLVCYKEYKDVDGTTVKIRERNNKKNIANGKPYNVVETTYDVNGEAIKSITSQYKEGNLVSTRKIITDTMNLQTDSTVSVKREVEYISRKEDGFEEKEVSKQIHSIYTLPFKEFGLLY